MSDKDFQGMLDKEFWQQPEDTQGKYADAYFDQEYADDEFRSLPDTDKQKYYGAFRTANLGKPQQFAEEDAILKGTKVEAPEAPSSFGDSLESPQVPFSPYPGADASTGLYQARAFEKTGEHVKAGAKSLGEGVGKQLQEEGAMFSDIGAERLEGASPEEQNRIAFDFPPGAIFPIPTSPAAIKAIGDAESVVGEKLEQTFKTKENKDGFIGDLTRVGGQILAQGGMSILNPYAGMETMRRMIQGYQLDDLRKRAGGEWDSPEQRDRAMYYSSINSMLQSGLETFGISKAMKFFKTRGKAWDILKGWLNGPGWEGATEWVQKYPEMVTNIFAENPDKNLLEKWEDVKHQFPKATKAGMKEGMMAALATTFLGVGGNAVMGGANLFSTQETDTPPPEGGPHGPFARAPLAQGGIPPVKSNTDEIKGYVAVLKGQGFTADKVRETLVLGGVEADTVNAVLGEAFTEVVEKGSNEDIISEGEDIFDNMEDGGQQIFEADEERRLLEEGEVEGLESEVPIMPVPTFAEPETTTETPNDEAAFDTVGEFVADSETRVAELEAQKKKAKGKAAKQEIQAEIEAEQDRLLQFRELNETEGPGFDVTALPETMEVDTPALGPDGQDLGLVPENAKQAMQNVNNEISALENLKRCMEGLS